MSEPNEPSYYEIALTRRQVTVAFVVLLVCMVISFLAGVWTVRAGLPAQAATAVASAPAAEAAAGAKLPEYQFFSEGAGGNGAGAAPKAAERPPAPAAVGAADQTLLDAVAGTSEPAAGATAGPESPDEAAPSPSGAPPLAASSPLPAIPPPSAAGADSDSTASVYRELEPGQMAVQVFSSADEKQARAILRQLRSAGYQVFLTPGSSGASRVFRVRIGPYTDRVAAQKVADEVKLRFKFDPWIAK